MNRFWTTKTAARLRKAWAWLADTNDDVCDLVAGAVRTSAQRAGAFLSQDGWKPFAAWLAMLLLTAAVTAPAQMWFTASGAGAVQRKLSARLGDTVSVCDFEATCPSGNDATAIANAVAVGANTVYLPASASCYSLGSTTISLPSGVTLRGAGMGGAASGPSCITYTGSGCAILLDSVSFAAVRDLDIQLNTTSATAAGICLKATTGVAEFNEIESVSIRVTNATRRNAGQVGVLYKDTGNGVFWNTARRLRLAYLDISVELVGGATQGTNANEFYNLMSWGHNTAFRAIATGGGFSVDNVVYGLKCSRSDGTFAGTATCLLLGDDGTNASLNSVYGLVSDQGAPSVCATIGQAGGSIAQGNVIESDCESGGPITDNNNGTFPNRIYESIAASTPGRMRMGRLVLSNELSLGAIPSTTGDIRLSNNQSLRWRNAANSADLTILVSDTNDRLQVGGSSAFLRLNNNIIEHGSSTVANSGNERYVHNWSNLGRNSANNANRTIWSWGATSDTLVLGDASATAIVNAPSTFASTQNSGTCALNAASPAVCTASVPSGSKCIAVPTGTTAAAATHTLATSVSSTTLTVTGANGLSDTVAYHCF